MRIYFDIDQAAAIAAGIDAPSRFGSIDIDPAKLDPAQRDFLSKAVSVDGYGRLFTRGGIADLYATIMSKGPEEEHFFAALNDAIDLRNIRKAQMAAASGGDVYGRLPPRGGLTITKPAG